MSPESLKAWRLAHELTQDELAELVGVGARQVRRWERGEARIPKLLEIYTEAN